MTELVRIEEKDGKQLVSARELHAFVESAERFSVWFNRMREYGDFEEGLDYTPYIYVHPLNDQDITDYAMTTDMAKEVSMLQRSDKGKQARRYFIRCESKLKEVYNKFKEIDLNTKAETQLGKKLNNIMTMRKCQLLYGDMLMYAAIESCKECGIDPAKYQLHLPEHKDNAIKDIDSYLIDRYLSEYPIKDVILSRVLFANYLNWFMECLDSKDRTILGHHQFNKEVQKRNYQYRRKSAGWCFMPKI